MGIVKLLKESYEEICSLAYEVIEYYSEQTIRTALYAKTKDDKYLQYERKLPRHRLQVLIKLNLPGFVHHIDLFEQLWEEYSGYLAEATIESQNDAIESCLKMEAVNKKIDKAMNALVEDVSIVFRKKFEVDQ